MGTSIKMFPGERSLYCVLTATLRSLSPFMRSICPSHLYRLFRIARTRSKALVFSLASTCGLRPVILLRQRALAPFIAAIVAGSRFHASEPYVNREHTAHLYTFIFRPKGIFELKTCVNLPILAIARLMRRLTSYRWSPSAAKMEPRYLKVKVLRSLAPSHSTLALAFCCASILSSCTLRAALVPSNRCGASAIILHERWCICTPLSPL